MGYIGNKRSERSQYAIESGLVTKSQLKAWQKRAVESGAVRPCEWHHTGKYFNKTNYFDLTDFEELNPKDFPLLKKIPEVLLYRKKKKKKYGMSWFLLIGGELKNILKSLVLLLKSQTK